MCAENAEGNSEGSNQNQKSSAKDKEKTTSTANQHKDKDSMDEKASDVKNFQDWRQPADDSSSHPKKEPHDNVTPVLEVSLLFSSCVFQYDHHVFGDSSHEKLSVMRMQNYSLIWHVSVI